MRRLQTGEDKGLNELMDRWRDPLVNYLIRYVGHREDAIDIAQEAFVRVYRNRQHFQAERTFSTWLYSIATNLARNHLRWRGRHPDRAGRFELKLELADSRLTPSQELVATERADQVRHAVTNLPANLREVVLLFYYQHLTHAEIAATLKTTPKAVEIRLRRSRSRLEALLKI